MIDSTEHFDEFWTASALSTLTRRAFAERMARFDPAPPPLDPWSRPGRPMPAARLDDGPLTHLLDARRSTRRFGPEPVTDADLGKVLSVLAGGPQGRRGHPAAGALYSVRVIALSFVAGRSSGRIIQHDPVVHTLTEIGTCPGWTDLVDDLGGQDAETPPAAVLGLFADPVAVLAKYGERGGRFVLLEAGAALQSLALATADQGLAGYPMGGASDARMLDLAGLTSVPARYVTGYAIGSPA